jgi:hypothetical protein
VRQLALGSLLILAACSGGAADSDEPLPDCDGRGEYDIDHGHCHCDPGFSPIGEGSCVASDGDTGIEDTGPSFDVLDLSADDATASVSGAAGSRVWSLVALDERLMLQVWIDEAAGGPTSPGEYPIDTDLSRCAVCVLVQTQCDAHGDHYHCGKAFVPAAGGTLTLDALGGPGGSWTGHLADVILHEVRFDDDGATAMVPDGKTWSLPFVALDAPVTAD